MRDVSKRTRSWFKVEPIADSGSESSLLYFGSAITAVKNAKDERMTIGPIFEALTGLHVIYSMALLRAAARKIRRTGLEKSK